MTIEQAKQAKDIIESMFDRETVRITQERFIALMRAAEALEKITGTTEGKKRGAWELVEDEDFSGHGYTKCTSCGYKFSFGCYGLLEHDNYCPHCASYNKR